MGRGSFLLASFPSLAKATQLLQGVGLPDGSPLQNQPYQFCFLFMGPIWTLLSPTSLLLARMAALKLWTEGTERLLIHKQPHSTKSTKATGLSGA